MIFTRNVQKVIIVTTVFINDQAPAQVIDELRSLGVGPYEIANDALVTKVVNVPSGVDKAVQQRSINRKMFGNVA